MQQAELQQSAKIIPLHAKTQQICAYRATCPVYQSTVYVGNPIAAIYSVITQSGLVLDGACNVQKEQVEDLLLAVDRLTVRLHRMLA